MKLLLVTEPPTLSARDPTNGNAGGLPVSGTAPINTAGDCFSRALTVRTRARRSQSRMAFVTLAALVDCGATGISPVVGAANRCPLRPQQTVITAATPSLSGIARVSRGTLATRITATAVAAEAHDVRDSTADPSDNARRSRGRPPRTNQQHQLQTPPRAPTASTRRHTRRPGVRRVPDSNVSGWRCAACGTQLHHQQMECSVCQTPKPPPGSGAYSKWPGGGRHFRADVRSRIFTNMIRGMPVGDWRGVLRELEEEERLEEADELQQRTREEGEVDEAAASLGAPSVHCYHAVRGIGFTQNKTFEFIPRSSVHQNSRYLM